MKILNLPRRLWHHDVLQMPEERETVVVDRSEERGANARNKADHSKKYEVATYEVCDDFGGKNLATRHQ